MVVGRWQNLKMSNTRTNNLHFLPKSCDVSGLDSSKDNSMSLVLSTMLAAYCRADTYANGSDAVEMSVAQEITNDKGVSMGIYHFALPTGATNPTAHIISSKSVEVEKGIRSEIHFNPAGTTVIDVSHDDFYQQLDEESADIYRQAKELLSNEHWQVFAVIPEKSVWEDQSYFAYIVEYTLGSVPKRSCIAFFKKEDRAATDCISRANHVRRVMSGNLNAGEGYSRYYYDETARVVKKAMKDGKPWFIKNKDTQVKWSDDYYKLSKDQPHPYDLIVAPSVQVYESSVMMTRPGLHTYADIFFLYLYAIETSWVALPADQRNRQRFTNANTGPQDDIKVFDPYTGIPLVIITTYVAKEGRHTTTISTHHSNIMRLIAGSAPHWVAARLKGTGTETDHFKTRGFGCLNRDACREAANANTRTRDVYRELRDTPDNIYNELIGMSTEEIEDAIFVDAGYYRSLHGTYSTYCHRISLKTGYGGVVGVQASMISCYKEIFDDFFSSIIAPLVDITSNDNDQKHAFFIEILQKAQQYNGFMKGIEKSERESTKLVYRVDNPGYNVANELKGTYQRPEGGLFFACLHDEYEPRDHREISLDKTANNLQSEAAKKQLFQSARCPFGYLAKSYFESSRLFSCHLNFQMTLAVRTTGEKNSVVMLDKPQECEYQKVSCNFATRELSSTACEFFTNLSPNSEKLSPAERTEHQRKLDMGLKSLRTYQDLWKDYILTKHYIDDFIRAPVPPATPIEGDSVSYRENMHAYEELICGIALAKRFRLDYEDRMLESKMVLRTPNIYEIIPYIVNSSMSNDKLGQLPAMMAKYKNLVRNLYRDCDEVYKWSRLEMIFTADKEIASTPLTDLLNIDVIHGFILSQDYRFSNEWPGFLTRNQYLAMSASVYLTENRLIAAVDYRNQWIDSKPSRTSYAIKRENIEDFYKLLADDDQLYHTVNPKVFECYRGDESENAAVARFHDPLVNPNTIFANIADVPIYGVNNKDDIYVSTLEETLSANTAAMFMTCRSIAVKGTQDKKTVKFYYLNGKMEERQHRTTTGAGDNVGGIVISYDQSQGNFVNVKTTQSSDRVQDAGGDTLSERITTTSFVQLMMGQFRARVYEEKSKAKPKSNTWIKSNIILDLASGDMSSLSDLPPKNIRNNIQNTLGDTYDEFQMQILRNVGSGSSSESVDEYAKTRVRNFFATYRE